MKIAQIDWIPSLQRCDAMNVCASCAAEAWGLGLTIEVLRGGRPTKTDASYGHNSTASLTRSVP
jgi:hypothetical protein